jgi:aldehyde:ferredoxin oxidoreductase
MAALGVGGITVVHSSPLTGFHVHWPIGGAVSTCLMAALGVGGITVVHSSPLTGFHVHWPFGGLTILGYGTKKAPGVRAPFRDVILTW